MNSTLKAPRRPLKMSALWLDFREVVKTAENTLLAWILFSQEISKKLYLIKIRTVVADKSYFFD